jgi:formylglycine-generating enzyme required for sulfatase activity
VNPTNANLACSGYSTWTATAGAQENLPINCVNWYEAYAFCIWDGGFLPSMAEWEYAAAGGDEQRLYPWGSTSPGVANQYAIYGSYFSGDGGASFMAPVGTAYLGAGRWGQLDLAGELDEWSLDTYDGEVGNTPVYLAGTCIDCADISSANMRAARGGYYSYNNTSELLPTYAGGADPTSRAPIVGFRCARLP